MAEAKITVRAEDLASAVLDTINRKIKETGDESDNAAKKGSALQKFVDDLVPSGKNANATFTDLKGTLSEMWEHPTAMIKQLASAATEDLAPSLGVVGLAAGGAAATIAVLSKIAFELAEHAAEVGENIYELSIKTGISANSLSNLSHALTVVGGDLGQVGNAMFTFEKNMGENSDKVSDGLSKIGLSLTDIKKLEPDKQFLAIAEAISRTADPTLRNAAAAELFGQKLARDLMPTLLEVNDGLAKTAGMDVFTDEQARQAQEFQDDWRLLKLELSQTALVIGKDLMPVVKEVITFIHDHLDDLKTFAASFVPAPIRLVAEAARNLGDGFHYLHDTSYGLPLTMEQIDALSKKLTDSLHVQAQSVSVVNDKHEVESAVLSDLKTKYEEHHKATEDAEKAAKQWATVLDELNSVGADFHATLDGINGEIVDAVEYYLKAGVSQKVLAEAYDLTASQIHAISDALKEEKAWLDEVEREHEVTTKLAQQHEKEWRDEQRRLLEQSNRDTARSITETTGLWREYYDTIEKRTLSTTDYQKRKVQEWFADEAAKLNADDANWQAHYAALVAVARQRMEEIDRASQPYFADMKKLLDDLRGDWGQHFTAVLVQTGSWKDAAAAVFQQFRQEIEKVLADMLVSFTEHFLKGMFDAWAETLGSMAAKWTSIIGGLGGGGFFGWLAGLFGHGGGTGNPGGGPDVPPDPGGGPVPPSHDSVGGVIYAARGFPGSPQGTDVIPAWLTSGESVVTRDATARLGGPGAIDRLNRGGSVIDAAALHAAVDAAVGKHIDKLRRDFSQMPIMMKHALRGAH